MFGNGNGVDGVVGGVVIPWLSVTVGTQVWHSRHNLYYFPVLHPCRGPSFVGQKKENPLAVSSADREANASKPKMLKTRRKLGFSCLKP